MIYTASYFEPENHHGQIYGISRSTPRHITAPTLRFLAPSRLLLSDWHTGMSETDYTDRYRQELADRWEQISRWLVRLDPAVDLTLCCWERSGEFCHRNLVGRMIALHRADCWGGGDRLSPYPVGAIVALRYAPDRRYQVLSYQDLDQTAYQQFGSGVPLYSYTLRPLSGAIESLAYWYHQHLEVVSPCV